MKNLKLSIAVVGMLFMSAVATAEPYNGQVADEDGLTYPTAVVIDTNKLGVKSITAQINFGYRTGVSTVTAYDGRVSTMQITISSATALSSATARGGFAVSSNSALGPWTARNTLAVSSNGLTDGNAGYDIMVVTQSVTSLTGSTITLNDIAYREGIEWRVMADSATTALCISTSLTTSLIRATTVQGDLVRILFTAVQVGTHSLLYDLTSSTPNGHQISYSSFIAGVNNTSFTLNGITLRQGTDWFKDPAIDAATGTVVSIMDAIRDNFSTVSVTTAGTNGQSCIILAAIAGTAGNAFTLVSSSQAILGAGGATFSGGTGLANAWFEINHATYTQGTDWKMGRVSSETATSIAWAINRSSMTRGVKAEAIGAIVYSTPIAVIVATNSVVTINEFWGTTPNSWTMTTSTATALLSSGTFTGGRNRATLVVNGVAFRNGIEWLTGTSSLTATTNLAVALKANAAVSSYISFSSNGVTAVIYASSVYVNQPFLILTSSQGALAISSVTIKSADESAYGYLQGGLATSFSTATGKITGVNTFTAGMAVAYTTGTGGNTLTALTLNATYFIKSPTAVDFYLVYTASGAVAATTATIIPMTAGFANLTTTGAATYIFTPLPYSGTSTMTWTQSNDGVFYTTMTAANSVVWVGVSSGTTNTTTWNFGDFNYKYLRLHTNTAPTGAINQEVFINGKQ